MTIHVLHVITTLCRGGAERQLVNLVCNTDPSIVRHTVCYLHPPADFADELEAAGHEVIGLNLPRKWPWLFAPAKLAPLLKARQPDLVQTWLYEGDVGARLSMLVGPRIPMVTTLHLTTYDQTTIQAAHWPPRKVAALQKIDKFTARRTRPLFIACSRAVRDSAVRNLSLPPEDVRVIYNSIDQATLACEPQAPGEVKKEQNIPENGFIFLNVGRLEPQKGQPVLLRAFQKVAADLPNTYLVFVGEGSQTNALKALTAELGLTERVKFLGMRADVGACLEMSDVFVFPSLFEGLPLAPIEAMLKSLPCIVTRIEPVLELFADGDTGVVVTPGSVDELVAAMRKLHNDPELRKRLGAQARAQAVKNFDSRTGLHAWEQLYRELALKQLQSE
ncbi:MAG TPA: glycosyltransferase [Pyrinomonadaceae bacterium]|nr:glycosyltransferase [Pyrinomonadaceae bacterium]